MELTPKNADTVDAFHLGVLGVNRKSGAGKRPVSIMRLSVRAESARRRATSRRVSKYSPTIGARAGLAIT